MRWSCDRVKHDAIPSQNHGPCSRCFRSISAVDADQCSEGGGRTAGELHQQPERGETMIGGQSGARQLHDGPRILRREHAYQ